MPAKTKNIIWPEWVEGIQDTCLQETVREALVARDVAVRAGALQHRACRAVLAAADATLEQIELGKVGGKVACRKAAVAVRKYSTAVECVHPTLHDRG